MWSKRPVPSLVSRRSGPTRVFLCPSFVHLACRSPPDPQVTQGWWESPQTLSRSCSCRQLRMPLVTGKKSSPDGPGGAALCSKRDLTTHPRGSPAHHPTASERSRPQTGCEGSNGSLPTDPCGCSWKENGPLWSFQPEGGNPGSKGLPWGESSVLNTPDWEVPRCVASVPALVLEQPSGEARTHV